MHNLQELVNPGPGGTMLDRIAQLEAEEAQGTSVDQSERVVIVCNSLPLKMRHCLLYTSPSPRDGLLSRMPSSA